jgi:hypothetical protein
MNWQDTLIGDCFLCRQFDDQVAVTVPAAILAPTSSMSIIIAFWMHRQTKTWVDSKGNGKTISRTSPRRGENVPSWTISSSSVSLFGGLWFEIERARRQRDWSAACSTASSTVGFEVAPPKQASIIHVV